MEQSYLDILKTKPPSALKRDLFQKRINHILSALNQTYPARSVRCLSFTL